MEQEPTSEEEKYQNWEAPETGNNQPEADPLPEKNPLESSIKEQIQTKVDSLQRSIDNAITTRQSQIVINNIASNKKLVTEAQGAIGWVLDNPKGGAKTVGEAISNEISYWQKSSEYNSDNQEVEESFIAPLRYLTEHLDEETLNTPFFVKPVITPDSGTAAYAAANKRIGQQNREVGSATVETSQPESNQEEVAPHQENVTRPEFQQDSPAHRLHQKIAEQFDEAAYNDPNSGVSEPQKVRIFENFFGSPENAWARMGEVDKRYRELEAQNPDSPKDAYGYNVVAFNRAQELAVGKDEMRRLKSLSEEFTPNLKRPDGLGGGFVQSPDSFLKDWLRNYRSVNKEIVAVEQPGAPKQVETSVDTSPIVASEVEQPISYEVEEAPISPQSESQPLEKQSNIETPAEAIVASQEPKAPETIDLQARAELLATPLMQEVASNVEQRKATSYNSPSSQQRLDREFNHLVDVAVSNPDYQKLTLGEIYTAERRLGRIASLYGDIIPAGLMDSHLNAENQAVEIGTVKSSETITTNQEKSVVEPQTRPTNEQQNAKVTLDASSRRVADQLAGVVDVMRSIDGRGVPMNHDVMTKFSTAQEGLRQFATNPDRDSRQLSEAINQISAALTRPIDGTVEGRRAATGSETPKALQYLANTINEYGHELHRTVSWALENEADADKKAEISQSYNQFQRRLESQVNELYRKAEIARKINGG